MVVTLIMAGAGAAVALSSRKVEAAKERVVEDRRRQDTTGRLGGAWMRAWVRAAAVVGDDWWCCGSC